jgi:hypothetical protein
MRLPGWAAHAREVHGGGLTDATPDGPAVGDRLCPWVDPIGAPQALRDAASAEGVSVCEFAEHALFAKLWRQGTVDAASVEAVPLLLAALHDGASEPARRRFALDLLLHLAAGLPMARYPSRPPQWPEEADTTRWGAADARAFANARACRGRVNDGIARVLPLVRDPHDEVAIGAWMLLAGLGGVEAQQALREGVTREEGDRLASVLVGLAWWEPHIARGHALRCLRSEPRNLAVHAAAALALVDPEVVCDEALEVLCAPLGEFGETFLPQHVEGELLVGGAILALQGRARARAVDLLARRVDAGADEPTLAWHLTEAAFGSDPPPRSASELRPYQRRALEALLHAAAFDDMRWVLSSRGLPAEADALRRLLVG